jgi:hypothetical protein
VVGHTHTHTHTHIYMGSSPNTNRTGSVLRDVRASEQDRYKVRDAVTEANDRKRQSRQPVLEPSVFGISLDTIATPTCSATWRTEILTFHGL